MSVNIYRLVLYTPLETFVTDATSLLGARASSIYTRCRTRGIERRVLACSNRQSPDPTCLEQVP